MLEALHGIKNPSFTLSLVTNENPGSPIVLEHQWAYEKEAAVETALDLKWPKDVYSLSHVALPFAPDDPVYGGEPAPGSPGVTLGNLALRGENGVLRVSPAAMLRLRWNPFYSYLENRTLNFLELETQ